MAEPCRLGVSQAANGGSSPPPPPSPPLSSPSPSPLPSPPLPLPPPPSPPSQAGHCRHPPWAPPGVRGAACEGQTHHYLTKCPPHPPPRCALACMTGGNGRRRRGAGAPTVPRTGYLLPLPRWRTRRGLRAWRHPGCTARGGGQAQRPPGCALAASLTSSTRAEQGGLRAQGATRHIQTPPQAFRRLATAPHRSRPFRGWLSQP